MKKGFALTTLFIFFCGIINVKADSPLTSTPFYKACMDVGIVAYAKSEGLQTKVLKFLCKKKADPMHKFAAINALEWGNKSNIGMFEEYLLEKNKKLKPEVFEYLGAVSDTKPEET